MGRFAFPDFAVPGEFVLQYSWRGYYDCFDIALLPTITGSTTPIPIDSVNPIAFIKEEVSPTCENKYASVLIQPLP